MSAWVKPTIYTNYKVIYMAYIDANNYCYVYFSSTNQLVFYWLNGGVVRVSKVSSAVFRDPTSWYHIFFAQDTTLATAEDRFQLWVNGVRITSWAVNTNNGVQNETTPFGGPIPHRFGMDAATGGSYIDGYFARIAVTWQPSTMPTANDFGYFNTEINEWVSKSQSAVKAVVDAGGTNSFMLDFDNGTSLTTLGYDKSSKANNWTLNNVSLTAGTSYDWMLDVPGNSYCVLNPLDWLNSASALSWGNLRHTGGSSNYRNASSFAFASGKWYVETVCEVAPSGTGNQQFGLQDSSAGFVARVRSGDTILTDATTGVSVSWVTNDVLGMAVDADTKQVSFYKNGTLQGAAYSYNSTSELRVFVLNNFPGSGSTPVTNTNFGQRPFAYTPPAGFKALCQRNMPDPAILNPEKHFDTVSYVGDGAASGRNIACGTSPDLAWIKSRSIAPSNHFLLDSVRGATKVLGSNQTIAEYTNPDFGLGVGQFTVGDNAGSDEYNPNKLSASYAAWLWKAGGASVTNNAGSISSQVSANVTAGFSIVTYTGNLSSAGTATVGHGLGQAPGLIISKSRNNAGGDNGQWVARHKYLASVNHYLRLNTTDTPVDSSANGSMSASTSTVFSTNWTSGMNINGGTYVAYCFTEIPGFSKIFSYTGNGSADGPFVYCGFKPKWVLIKRIDAANGWFILDAIRNTTNVCNLELYPNLADAEGANTAADLTSSGFKLRGTDTWKNANGGTYIGIAFADVPAKYALAR
jgi:hypothetical protein